MTRSMIRHARKSMRNILNFIIYINIHSFKGKLIAMKCITLSRLTTMNVLIKSKEKILKIIKEYKLLVNKWMMTIKYVSTNAKQKEEIKILRNAANSVEMF